MELFIQGTVAAATLMLLGLGFTSMFAPAKMLANFSIEPIGTAGLSTIRSVIGGLFLASVALLAYGLITSTTLPFLAVAIILGAVAVGRIVSLVADGFVKSVVPPLIVELVIVAALVTAYLNLASL